MEGHLPLSTLLSQALVALTIEFDNEAEHRVPHRTTDHGATTGSLHAPWLVSIVIWTRFMQFVPEEGISVRELQRLARMSDKSMSMWLTRLGKWWGYLVVESDAAAQTPSLFRSLEPYQDGWRAAKPKPETLPHFPMVLRGGFPDGS